MVSRNSLIGPDRWPIDLELDDRSFEYQATEYLLTKAGRFQQEQKPVTRNLEPREPGVGAGAFESRNGRGSREYGPRCIEKVRVTMSGRCR